MQVLGSSTWAPSIKLTKKESLKPKIKSRVLNPKSELVPQESLLIVEGSVSHSIVGNWEPQVSLNPKRKMLHWDNRKTHNRTLWEMDGAPDRARFQYYWNCEVSSWERTEQNTVSTEELWNVLHKDWRTIHADYLKKLQDSLPKRGDQSKC